MTTIEHTSTRTAAGDRNRHERNALTVAEDSFVLLTSGPRPLAIDGRAIGHGLPPCPVDLRELRILLLRPTAGDAFKDAVWRHLVDRARTGDPAWVVGCAGVAMPGLKNTAARVLRSSPPRLADDIVSELLTEFVAQLEQIDLARPHIAARLMLWARKGALRARAREMRAIPCDPCEIPAPHHAHGMDADPVDLVREAVRQRIITTGAAELIVATRLDGISVRDVACHRGVTANQLYKRRQVAEARLVAALSEGRLTAITPLE